MAAFTVVEDEAAEEPAAEEAPAEEAYPEGNPFDEEPLEATRRINLSELKFGRNYTNE